MEIGDYYDLEKNKKTIISRKEENGFEDQEFYKEEVKWVVFDIKEDETLIISEKPLEQEIWLEGEIGYKNGIETLNRLCREITGREEARSITEEDIINSEYWKDEKKRDLIFGKDENFYYWLASRFADCNSAYAYFGLRRVNGSSFSWYRLFYSNNSTSSSGFLVRPIISIKEKNLKDKYNLKIKEV